METKIRTGTYGVAVKEGKILLITQTGGLYKGRLDLPGGGIEVGESIEQALQREFREEVAMKFKRHIWFDNMTYLYSYRDFMTETTRQFFQIGLIYFVDELFQVDAIDHELRPFAWYEIDKLSQEHLSPFAWNSIKKLLKT